MADEYQLKAEQVLDGQQGIARTKDLLEAGLTHYYINKLETLGAIVRVRHGLYRQADQKSRPVDEIADVAKIVPKGVICLMSALAYYELTTYIPWEYQVAIHRESKQPKLPDYPPIKVIYFSDIPFNLGISEEYIEGTHVRIYDREKTICDLVKYREKVGIDLMKEGLRNYLRSPEKNITKLVAYAEQLRIKNVLHKYLEVLV